MKLPSLYKDRTAGIIFTWISDHFPCFRDFKINTNIDIKRARYIIADIIQISKNKSNGIKCIVDDGRPVTNQLKIANKNWWFLYRYWPLSHKEYAYN